ncbi:MAG: hypothetical protein Q9225_002964 [Loekoesia sp. 1 TL-2023]
MANSKRYSMPPSYSQKLPETSSQRIPQPTADGMNPSSELLQDLLREKKAAQHARRTSLSEQVAYERQVQSSPIASSTANQADKSTNRRTSGYTAPKEMGLREMEDYISKINKQNFDLKLEVFHRRQRSEALEAKAKNAEELEAQNEELRQVNEDLLEELEKRDVAVQEAVALICDLEAKIDQLETEQFHDRRLTGTPTNALDHLSAQSSQAPEPPMTPLPSYGSRKTTEATLESKRLHTPSPSRANKEKQDDSLFRTPSFLRDAKPSTSALRGLFTSKDEDSTANGSKLGKPSMRSLRRAGSFFSQDEYPENVDADTFSLEPRRLSLLSESSFVSVYGKNKEKITPSTAHRDAVRASPTHEDDVSFARKLSPQEGRIRSWIESKDHPASPSKRPVQGVKPDTFSSIGAVLGPNRPNPRDLLPSISPTPSKRQHQNVSAQPLGKPNHNPSFGGPIFGPDVLPPTPETMSTATLGGRSSNHSIVADRSLNGVISRPTSGTTAVSPEARPFGLSSGNKLGHSYASQQTTVDNDTDIEVSDDERQHVEASVSTHGRYNQSDNHFNGFSHDLPLASGSSKPNRALDTNTSRRPPLMSPCTDFMFNGEDLESIRPARTISYPSPGGSHQSTAKDSSKASGQVSASSRDHVRNGGNQSITQQEKPTPNPPETSSPESRIRPPRPSSMYMRSTSSQSPSAAPLKVTRVVSRPETSGGLAADTRRHSVSLKPGMSDDVMVAGRGKAQEQVQQQQNNKRLSVGAIGRSASLRIKEGFGRKK